MKLLHFFQKELVTKTWNENGEWVVLQKFHSNRNITNFLSHAFNQS